MNRILFFILFPTLLFLSFASNAQITHAGSRSSAMGYCGVASSDLFSVFNNQAGLGNLKEMSGGVSFENRFLVNALSSRLAAFVFPTSSGTFGASYRAFGYSQYSESIFGISYGKKLGKIISAGIQLDYVSLRLPEIYGSKGFVTFEAGVQAIPVEHLTMGFHLFNPLHQDLTGYAGEMYNTTATLGGQYEFSEKVTGMMEVEKETNFRPSFRAGLEYHVVKPVYIRAGLTTQPFQNSFGFGMEFKNFRIDLASLYHPVLGYTPSVSLIWKAAPKNVSGPGMNESK
ncbi:MAG: hypothetical protein V2A54_03565 [Bacteroidota bacterium]